MKNLKYKIASAILTSSVWLACALPTLAQTNNLPFGTTNITVGGITLANVPTNDIPQSTSSLISTVEGFFTSFTGLQTFQTNDTLDLWTGAEQVGGNNTAATLGLSYNNSHLRFSNVQIGIESVTRAAGVAGTILSQGAGANVQYIWKDVKLIGFVDGDYEFDANKPAVEVGARIWKALTDHTYAGPSLSWRSSTPNHATTFGFEIGGAL
jgi:hypothetical protein